MEDYQFDKTYQAFSKSKGSMITVQKIKIQGGRAAAPGVDFKWYEVFVNKKNNIVTLGDPVKTEDIRILPSA